MEQVWAGWSEDQWLSCLTDRSLYLGWLPGDIQNYYLKPLLRANRRILPSKVSPKFVGSIAFRRSVEEFIILLDGSFLLVQWQPTYQEYWLNRWNPQTERWIYGFQIGQIEEMLYDVSSDTLIVYHQKSSTQVIPLITSIWTEKDFLSASRNLRLDDQHILNLVGHQLVHLRDDPAFPQQSGKIVYYAPYLICLEATGNFRRFLFYRI